MAESLKHLSFLLAVSMWGTDRLFLYTSKTSEAIWGSAADTRLRNTGSKLNGAVPRALAFLTRGSTQRANARLQ